MLLVSGRFAVSQTIIPEAQEHFLTPSAHRDTHIFGGLGFRLTELDKISPPALSRRAGIFLLPPGMDGTKTDGNEVHRPQEGAVVLIVALPPRFHGRHFDGRPTISRNIGERLAIPMA